MSGFPIPRCWRRVRLRMSTHAMPVAHRGRSTVFPRDDEGDVTNSLDECERVNNAEDGWTVP